MKSFWKFFVVSLFVLVICAIAVPAQAQITVDAYNFAIPKGTTGTFTLGDECSCSGTISGTANLIGKFKVTIDQNPAKCNPKGCVVYGTCSWRDEDTGKIHKYKGQGKVTEPSPGKFEVSFKMYPY